MELDTLRTHWQWTLDAASHAHHAGLAHERADTARALRRWLPPGEVHPAQLGLPAHTEMCFFELEHVLTNSDAVHVAAWQHVLDEILLRHADETERAFVPFEPDEEYALYFDARPRISGLVTFLASRGIRLSSRELDEVAARKARLVGGQLQHRGINALPGAHRYLLAAGFAHVTRVAIAESARAHDVLNLAGLAHLVDRLVPPTPEALARAAHGDAAAITRSDAATAAAREAGIPVVDAPSLRQLLAPWLRD